MDRQEIHGITVDSTKKHQQGLGPLLPPTVLYLSSTRLYVNFNKKSGYTIAFF